jgi:hypothetical protein
VSGVVIDLGRFSASYAVVVGNVSLSRSESAIDVMAAGSVSVASAIQSIVAVYVVASRRSASSRLPLKSNETFVTTPAPS